MKKFLALLILIICIPSYANNILHDAETILPGANKAKKAEILFYAVKAKNYTIINLALQYNAKADYQDEQGYTTLMYAAQNLSLEYVQRLLDAGGSKTVTYTNFLGMTALNYAETRTYTSSDMTQKLLSLMKNSDLKYTSSTFWQTATVDDVNNKLNGSYKGHTPLYYAVETASYPVLEAMMGYNPANMADLSTQVRKRKNDKDQVYKLLANNGYIRTNEGVNIYLGTEKFWKTADPESVVYWCSLTSNLDQALLVPAIEYGQLDAIKTFLSKLNKLYKYNDNEKLAEKMLAGLNHRSDSMELLRLFESNGLNTVKYEKAIQKISPGFIPQLRMELNAGIVIYDGIEVAVSDDVLYAIIDDPHVSKEERLLMLTYIQDSKLKVQTVLFWESASILEIENALAHYTPADSFLYANLQNKAISYAKQLVILDYIKDPVFKIQSPVFWKTADFDEIIQTTTKLTNTNAVDDELLRQAIYDDTIPIEKRLLMLGFIKDIKQIKLSSIWKTADKLDLEALAAQGLIYDSLLYEAVLDISIDEAKRIAMMQHIKDPSLKAQIYLFWKTATGDDIETLIAQGISDEDLYNAIKRYFGEDREDKILEYINEPTFKMLTYLFWETATIEEIKTLAAQGIDFSKTTIYRECSCHSQELNVLDFALNVCHIEGIKILLGQNPEPDYIGAASIIRAANCGDIKIVEKILSAGKNIHELGILNALRTAEQKSPEIASLLYEEITDPTLKILNATFWKTATADDVRSKLAEGALVNSYLDNEYDDSFSILNYALLYCSNAEALQVLLEQIDSFKLNSSYLSISDTAQEMLLTYNIRQYSLEEKRDYLNTLDPDKVNVVAELEILSQPEWEEYPFHISKDQLISGNIINRVYKNVQNPTLKMMNRQFWRSATPEDVRKLIAQGADINAAFESSMTCDADTYRMLDFALRFGNKEMVEALLSASPDISYESRLGITPLIAAAALHDMDILILLWEAGAKDTVNQATNNAYTAMDLANDKTKDFLTLHSGKAVYKTAPVTVPWSLNLCK